MPTARKIANVTELQDLIARSRIAITTDYRGLSVTELATVRNRLREIGVEVKVAKITLASIAAELAGKPRLAEVMRGPTAIAFGFGDETEPARVLTEFLRTSRLPMSITGALMGNQALSPEQVGTLATLPSKEILLGQLLGSIQSPIAGLASVLNNILASLAWALQARIRQLEEQGGAA